MRKLVLTALAALFTVGLANAGNNAPPPPGKVSFKEKLLAEIPADVQLFKDISFSFNGQYVAYTAVKAGKMHVAVNNKMGPAYASIADKPVFVKDGKTVVYRANTGGGWQVIIGGRPGPGMAMVGKPVYSPDFKRFAFEGSRGTTGASDKSAWRMYIDGKPVGKEYASLGPPVFSADNKKWAHTARVGKAGQGRAFHTVYVMVTNGKPSAEISPEGKMSTPVFAPVGSNMAYRQLDRMWSMVLNGSPEGQYAEVGNPFWSPDGKKCAYKATPDRKSWYMMVGGEKRGPFDAIGDPTWKLDSSDVSYKFSKEGKWFVMINGEEHGPHPVAEAAHFSEDGESWAYPAIYVPPGKFRGKWTMLHNGKPGPIDLDAIYGPPVLSPDGKHVAYQAGWRYKWIIVMDDGKGSMYDTVGIPVWNPAGTKIAYSARQDGKWYMQIHYRRLEPFDEILTPPVWNKDGSKVAFGCRKDRTLTWRVVDVKE